VAHFYSVAMTIIKNVRSVSHIPFIIFNMVQYGPGVDSTSNRNEYQESPGGKGRPAVA
jgi:hypothetical protein